MYYSGCRVACRVAENNRNSPRSRRCCRLILEFEAGRIPDFAAIPGIWGHRSGAADGYVSPDRTGNPPSNPKPPTAKPPEFDDRPCCNVAGQDSGINSSTVDSIPELMRQSEFNGNPKPLIFKNQQSGHKRQHDRCNRHPQPQAPSLLARIAATDA